jgi:hypothetical protein
VSFSTCPTLGEGEFAVDMIVLLTAQVEELRLLAGPALRTEHQRAVFADNVAARARRLREQNPEGAPPLLAAPPPRLMVEASMVVTASKPPKRPKKADTLAHLSPFERSVMESQRLYLAAKATSDAQFAKIRGGVSA